MIKSMIDSRGFKHYDSTKDRASLVSSLVFFLVFVHFVSFNSFIHFIIWFGWRRTCVASNFYFIFLLNQCFYKILHHMIIFTQVVVQDDVWPVQKSGAILAEIIPKGRKVACSIPTRFIWYFEDHDFFGQKSFDSPQWAVLFDERTSRYEMFVSLTSF